MDGATCFVNLGRLGAAMRREFGARLAEETWAVEAGVRPPTFGILSVVAKRGPVSQREVSDLIGVHASDVVEMMDLVEEKGWIARERDPEDRRRYRLTITPAGRKVLARFMSVAAAAERTVLEPLSGPERARLADLLAKVVEVA